MLEFFREHMSRWVTFGLVGILSLGFGLWGVQYYLTSTGHEGLVAKVNGSKITQREVDRTYDRIRQQQLFAQGKRVALSPTQQKNLKQQVVNQLIKTTVLSKAAEDAGFLVTQGQVQSVIAGMPLFQQAGHFSSAQFEQVLGRLLYTPDSFVQETHDMLLITQVEQGLIQTSFVLPNEIKKAISLARQQRDFRYVLFTRNSVKHSVQLDDEKLKNYYHNHTEEFKTEPRVQLEYIMLDATALKKQLKVSNEDLKTFYENNIDSFKKNGKTQPYSAVKSRVRQLVLKQGLQKVYTEAYDKLSENTYTNPDSLEPAANDLNLKIQTTEWITAKGSKTGLTSKPKILEVAFSDALLKQRDNSTPITLDDEHVVVIRVKNYEPATAKPFNDVREKVKKAMRVKLEKDLVKAKAQEAYADIAKAKLNWKTVKKADRNTTTVPKGVLEAAFKPDVLKKAEYSLINLQNGDYAILELQKIHDGSVPKLSAKEEKAQRNLMVNLVAAESYGLYVKSARERYKVKRY